ncbi:MAG: tetratricopeptide repeat protein [Heliobacteriaceae bacterium]|nr:tetratricopeptide repeat protein [Heliobacteriaceae bacterium]MDD4587741.1 tetratricopeptide repeat protein [Heliobacteriaceae bacterium]
MAKNLPAGSSFFQRRRLMVTILAVLVSVGLLGTTLIPLLTAVPSGSQQAGGGQEYSQQAEEQSKLDAVKLYEGITVEEPANVQAWLNLGHARHDLGVVYLKTGKADLGVDYFRQAVTAYEKVLELQPEDVNTRVMLATVAYYAGMADTAENHFKLALAQDPGNLNVYLNYGLFLLEVRQDPAAAKGVWEQALALNPPSNTVKYIKKMIESATVAGEPPTGKAE